MAKHHAGVDLAALQDTLQSLAHASRLELLFRLQRPLTLDEIRLQPGASRAYGNPNRPISRQSVQHHLAQLVEAGLIRVRETRRKGLRPVHEYVVDQARLFAVAEDFRKVTAARAAAPIDSYETLIAADHLGDEWSLGPKLILVHGVGEGRHFPLSAVEAKSGRGWVIGRRRDAHVSLEYDPFVSLENAELVRDGGRFRLLDLRTNRNGTFLNWKRLAIGGETEIRCGDVIGVGRSLLVFRDT